MKKFHNRKLISKEQSVLISFFISSFCFFMPFIFFIFTFKFNIETFNDNKIIILIFFLYLMFLCWFIKKFKENIASFIYTIGWDLSISISSSKNGNAISKEDFRLIKHKNKRFYDFITSDKCNRYCIASCFEILKTLQCGSILFIGASCNWDKDNRFAHVLYVNNGWAFDTISHRQTPIKYLLVNLYEAKIYKEFFFKDIKDVSYKDFCNLIKTDLNKWCKENGVRPIN